MKVGMVSDIHGNRIALDAVVADGRAIGVDRWWALGDLVAVGPDPASTLELLANLPGLAVVRGNTERYVLTGDRPSPDPATVLAEPHLFDLYSRVSASFGWTRGFLAAAGWIEWLADLPAEHRMTMPDGTRVLAVHSSPVADDGRGLNPDSTDAELAELLVGAEADLVCAGHTHRPLDRSLDGMRIANLGSVSNPITGDRRASYLVVHADRHATRIEHRRVAYDVDRFLERVQRSSYPDADFIASFQRGEQVRYPDE